MSTSKYQPDEQLIVYVYDGSILRALFLQFFHSIFSAKNLCLKSDEPPCRVNQTQFAREVYH